jgi:hypothetical protein
MRLGAVADPLWELVLELMGERQNDSGPVTRTVIGAWMEGMECRAAQPGLRCWSNGRSMTFRIETAARGRFTVFVLSGRIEKGAIDELRTLFELQKDYHVIVLDLKDVGVINRDVVRFSVRCEADGVKLENCASYIREWMEREKD